jgi:hypothetical protein
MVKSTSNVTWLLTGRRWNVTTLSERLFRLLKLSREKPTDSERRNKYEEDEKKEL